MKINTFQLAGAFNEWMRRYTDDPEQFQNEYETVKRFLAEKTASENVGPEPAYGMIRAGYLEYLVAELSGAGAMGVNQEPQNLQNKAPAVPRR